MVETLLSDDKVNELVSQPSKWLFAEWDHLQVNRNCDGFLMMIQLTGTAGCVTLYEKACSRLHF